MNLSLLIIALIAVESSGDPNAIGDNGLAYGCLQLHSAYVQDAAEYARQDWTHEDAFNPATAEQIVRAYMARYATKKRLGREPTYSDLARMHNGGPNGSKKAATDKYWQKVKKKLEQLGVQGL
jgi:soluble lytic murein transglycosylase-like protein|tara:strand:+ start:79 stop:447 length:369 start_codon:yes stop_codon:yes gene_type:complete